MFPHPRHPTPEARVRRAMHDPAARRPSEVIRPTVAPTVASPQISQPRLDTIQCTECGGPIERKSRRRAPTTVCSDECKLLRRRRQERERRKRKLKEIFCAECGAPIEQKPGRGRPSTVCSPECEVLRQRRWAREWHHRNPRGVSCVGCGAPVGRERQNRERDGSCTECGSLVERTLGRGRPLTVCSVHCKILSQIRQVLELHHPLCHDCGFAALLGPHGRARKDAPGNGAGLEIPAHGA
jgi:hypothetical protein